MMMLRHDRTGVVICNVKATVDAQSTDMTKTCVLNRQCAPESWVDLEVH